MYDEAIFEKCCVRCIIIIGRRKKTYIAKISKEINMTYSATTKAINYLEQKGIINSSKINGSRCGIIRIIELTNKGRMIYSNFENIIRNYKE